MASFPTPRANEYLAILEERLPQKTFRHCVSVAQHIAAFHEQAEVDIVPAVTAGLLHDLCKAQEKGALLAAAAKWNIEVTPYQRKKPTMLHGPVAAEELRRELHVDDEDVCDAIFWHTTGRPEWTRLGLALYLADFSEPLRTIPQAAKARTILDREGFIQAVRFAAEQKLAYVEGKVDADPVTAEFFQWLKRAAL